MALPLGRSGATGRQITPMTGPESCRSARGGAYGLALALGAIRSYLATAARHGIGALGELTAPVTAVGPGFTEEAIGRRPAAGGGAGDECPRGAGHLR